MKNFQVLFQLIYLEAICDYIVNTEIHNMIGDGFALLVIIFETENFKVNYITKTKDGI